MPNPSLINKASVKAYALEVAKKHRALDEQDGFPRYFFGDEEAAKAQLETWCDRRPEVIKP